MPNDLNSSSNQEEQEFSSSNESNNSNQAPIIENNELTKGQKISAMFLAFFGLAVIIVWMVQFRSGIINSNNRSGQNNSAITDIGGNGQSASDTSKIDSDNDGLSDWDELNVYNTSPYLEDSDSDGFSDYQEVSSNNDPNCPVGRDCYNLNNVEADNFQAQTNTEDAFVNNLIDNSVPDIQASSGEQATGQGDTLENVLSGKVDAATLRQVLLDSGMDASILGQISDDELMRTYEDTLGGE